MAETEGPTDPPHDVLAAEGFAVPAVDPVLHDEPPRDVLAAEEFGVPAADPVLHHHGVVALPGDLTGIGEPHDVLAAEEFAMPAPPPPPSPGVADESRGPAGGSTWKPLIAAGVLAAVGLRRRRRR